MRNEKVKHWTMNDWVHAPRMMFPHWLVCFCLFSLSTHQMPSSHHPPQCWSCHREWRIQHRYQLPKPARMGLARRGWVEVGAGQPAMSPSLPWRETEGPVQEKCCSVTWVCTRYTRSSFWPYLDRGARKVVFFCESVCFWEIKSCKIL